MSQPSTVALRAALEAVRAEHRPNLLLAPARVAIRAALTQIDLPADSTEHAIIERTLASAQTYEADGMYAFVPLWDDLFRRLGYTADPAEGS